MHCIVFRNQHRIAFLGIRRPISESPFLKDFSGRPDSRSAAPGRNDPAPGDNPPIHLGIIQQNYRPVAPSHHGRNGGDLPNKASKQPRIVRLQDHYS